MAAARIWAMAAAGAAVLTAGCATPRHAPVTAEGAAPIGGALGGYLLDDLIGGRRTRTARIVGAGIAGTPGTDIGGYMDRQERELRERTAGTETRVTRTGDDLVLTIPSGLSFAYKSDAVAPAFQPTLDQVAGVLHAYDRSYIDVYGHSDATGSAPYNQALSQRRAASVASYLVAHGVQQARVATKGFGKTQPIASNDTPEGQAANRRVEIKIVPIHANELR